MNDTKIEELSPTVPPKDEVTCPNLHQFDHKKASVVPCSHVYFLNYCMNELNLRNVGEVKKEAPLPVEEVIQQQGVRNQLSSSENEINDGFSEIENVAVSPEPVVVVEEEMEQVLEDATNHSGISEEIPNDLELANKVIKEQINAMRRVEEENGGNEMTAQVHPYNCIYCRMGFYHERKLIRHMCVHTGEKPYKCQECQKSFYSKKVLRNHATKKHKPKTFTCPKCPGMFATEKRLKKHKALEHPSKRSSNRFHPRRLYACKLCPWSFSWEKDLRRHDLRHTGERKYLCRKCERKFKRKDNLKRHFRGLHGLSIEETNQLLREARLE